MGVLYNKKQIGEVECVKKFLKNKGIDFNERDIRPYENENNIVDVLCGDEKFQIVHADHEFPKLINTAPKDEHGVRWVERPRNPKDVWNDFVVKPIEKKVNKYGKSAREIILLIDSYTWPPFLENQIVTIKKSNSSILKNSNFKEIYFKEIYIVCPGKNIKVYP